VEQYTRNDDFRAELGEDRLMLGLVRTQMGRSKEANDSFSQAEELLKPLADTHPSDERYTLSLAGVYVNWGNLLDRQHESPRALEKLDRAVALADAARTREPLLATARERSVEAHGSRAEVLKRLGRNREAIPDWKAVVEYSEGNIHFAYRANYATLLLNTGYLAEAAREARQLSGVPALGNDERYNVACILARFGELHQSHPAGMLFGLASIENHAQAAVRILQQLAETGYFRQAHSLELLKADPDLALLRTRSDFQNLLASILN
jgi:tetratricopeptide (TPR) repeat protein